MKKKISFALLGLFGLFVLGSVLGGSLIWSVLGLAETLDIDGKATLSGAPTSDIGNSWAAYGGDGGGNRYSAAQQINTGNVDQLEIAWTHSHGGLDGLDDELARRTAFSGTPILVNDSLIFCTPFNRIIAVDPRTGEEKWRFDAEVAKDRRPGNAYQCRGVSYWEDSANADQACAKRVFMGTVDARLIAVDADSGKKCDGFGDQGEVRIKPSVSLRWPGEFQITSAPAIAGDILVTGTSISDNLRTDAPKGTVFAFDVRSGKTVWTFNPVEGSGGSQPEPDGQANTLPGHAPDGQANTLPGHANVWTTISVDAARGLVFLPTSSLSPDYFGGNRPGDNPGANSVIALDVKSGKPAWNFQVVHHDVWDFDLPAQSGLHSVWKDGKSHDVVAQFTKQGLLFVLDRDSGAPFLPIEERSVPQDAVAGEKLSPTQPFPVTTPSIISDRMSPDDAFGISYWDKRACAKQIENLRSDGLYTPPTLGGTLAYPFSGGGANWGGSAFDPARNLLLINMSNVGQRLRLHKKTGKEPGADELGHDAEYAPMEGSPYGMSRALLLSPLGLPCTPPPWGVLAAVDLASGQIVWRKTLGTTADLAPGGVGLSIGTPNFGGPMITAGGLVFIGAAMDDYLRAFDVETGTELWKGRLPAGGQATPMSYSWKGRQYVVIAAGGHGRAGTTLGDHLVAFALPVEK